MALLWETVGVKGLEQRVLKAVRTQNPSWKVSKAATGTSQSPRPGVTGAGKTGPGVLQAGSVNKGISLEGQTPTEFSIPFPADGPSVISVYGKIIDSRLQEAIASPSGLLILLQLANNCSWEMPPSSPARFHTNPAETHHCCMLGVHVNVPGFGRPCSHMKKHLPGKHRGDKAACGRYQAGAQSRCLLHNTGALGSKSIIQPCWIYPTFLSASLPFFPPFLCVR